MSNVSRTALAAVVVAAFMALASAASAQSLVGGVWSHRVVGSEGPIAVIWDEFDANGHFQSRFVTPKGTISLTGSYQLLSGGAVVRAVYTDWQPKQTCTMVCTPNPSPMPIGRPGDSPLRWAGPNVVYFGGDMYTRQR